MMWVFCGDVKSPITDPSKPFYGCSKRQGHLGPHLHDLEMKIENPPKLAPGETISVILKGRNERTLSEALDHLGSSEPPGKSRMVSFMATAESHSYLNGIESGLKSKVINRALAFYQDSKKSPVLKFVNWLVNQPKYDSELDQQISDWLVRELKKYSKENDDTL